MTSSPKVIILAGFYGSGKTSIVNYYPHEPCADGVTTKVKGFLSIGGKRGADDFKSYKMTKIEYYNKIFDHNSSYLIHGALFHNRPDLFHYSRNHKVYLIVLETRYDEVKKRVLLRNPNSNVSLKKYVMFERIISRLVAFCNFKKYKVIRVDNNGNLQETSKKVWEIIEKIDKGTL